MPDQELGPTGGIDPGTFRNVLGHYPTGVVVVTSQDDDGPIGAVMGSFASVSLDPPLVSFMPTKDSGSWQRIEKTGSFAVNVLTADQVDVCVAFFKKDPSCWDSLEWRRSALGSPITEDALAWIDCRIANVVDAGDHIIVLGEVADLSANETEDLSPLLFFKGGYGRFDS